MNADGFLRVLVGPGLAFEFELPEALLRRVARFLLYFVDGGGGADPAGELLPALLVTSEPPPAPTTPGSIPGSILLEEPPLVVHRAAEATLFELPRVRGWCDAERGRAGIRLDEPSEAELDLFVGMALAPMLIELAAGRGWFGVHAAGVAIEDAGILLPGPSGAGKSTIFAHARRAGLDLLSDDLLWLRPVADGTLLYPFPRGAYAAPAPAPTASGVALRAIACPVVLGGRESRLVPLAFSQALEILIEQGGFLGSGALAEDRFRTLVRVAHSVPGYRLEAGRRRSEAPALLAELAARLTTAAASPT